ncbi:NOP9 [Sanghuangporus weigelae]
MPRENRKRGKKHKKQQQDEAAHSIEAEYREEGGKQTRGPSWIVERNRHGVDDAEGRSLDAPFGYADPDLKAYFKTVDEKLREWQETDEAERFDGGETADPNEERRMFLVAALQELSGKEKQLATDPECSNILERMAYSMDDFVKRVLVDRLAGSYEALSRHRFGSHVVQTLLSVAKGAVCREARGVIPPSPEAEEDEDERGHLPLLTELIINICDELLPSTTSLSMDPFASHVLRALFLLLCPSLPSASDASSILRSKKSAKHRARQGPMKSILTDNAEQDDNVDGKGKAKAVSAYPAEFESAARRFVKKVRDELNGNEVRALAADKVACPVLVLLLEMESIQGDSYGLGSLMDSVSAGLISTTHEGSRGKLEPSDYVMTLLREATASHLLERLVALAPESAFDAMWDLYFVGKLNRLATHPVANFVVARAVERANDKQLSSVLEELKGVWPKLTKNARTGVLKALVDRTVQLKSKQEDAVQATFDAFGFHDSEEQESLVECILYLKTFSDFDNILKQALVTLKEGENAAEIPLPSEPTVQGSLLIQSLVRLDAPHNQPIIQSLIRLPAPRLLAVAHHPTSSRILDAFLSSPTIPPSARRQLILAFQGHFPALVDHRIGQHVGERLWGAADPYLKEKFARGLIPHENLLLGSRYGKFFVRGLNLYLLKRDPEKWKTQQVQNGRTVAAKTEVKKVEYKKVRYTVEATSQNEARGRQEEKGRKRKQKRKAEVQDVIDELFDSTFGKRQKKGNLNTDADATAMQVDTRQSINKSKEKDLLGDEQLGSVFTAIRNAPKELKPSGKKKK